MADPWPDLAKAYGRKSVMSLAIDDATLDAETERQAGVIFPMIREQLRGDERTALDYGCGCGRFMPYLARLPNDLRVTGFDPCKEMLDLIHWGGWAATDDWTEIVREQYDIVFTAMVLGDPGLDLEPTVAGLVSVLSQDGLMVVLDHMPDTEPRGRWWRFRAERAYVDTFARHGVALRRIGTVMQLDNEVTVLAGRR